MSDEIQQEEPTEEEKELIQIEELSQRLELLYKDMEQIRRENMLFESYLIRNSKDIPKEEEVDDKKGKKAKKEKTTDKKNLLLTNEEKYEIAQFESDALKKNIDDGRLKSDSILETLRAILEETDMTITEIRKDAFDFQREILIGGENSRTGKIEAERIVKYFEEKLRQRDALTDKYRQKKQTLESQIFKTNNQIIKKEEMGDDLKFIDFHQLQIENKKYVKEIDEKNKKLLSLKISTGKISSSLIEEKINQQHEIEYNATLHAEIADKTKNITKTQSQIAKVIREKDKLDQRKKILEKQIEMVNNQDSENVPKPIYYVNLKKRRDDLNYSITNIERKIDIASFNFNKAMKSGLYDKNIEDKYRLAIEMFNKQ